MASPLFEETLVLVRAAQGGDELARDSLLERYYPRVRQIVALRMGRTSGELQEYDDIVQETLMDAFRALDAFSERSEGSFRNWLARIVENNIRDQLRRDRAQKRGEGRVKPMAAYGSSVLGDSVLRGREPTPSQEVVARELEQRLERALLSLDERSRRAIEMRKLCECSYAEIASELGVRSESSARSLVARAMSRLSERL